MTQQAVAMTSDLDPDELVAIVEGRHGDPFGVLGPHKTANGETKVRTFFPGSLGVELLDSLSGTVLAVSARVHPAGVFEASVESGAKYRLKILWPGGAQETDDPYRFAPLLGELDLHLISQGTHYQLASALGANPIWVEDVEGVRFAVWAPNARRVSVVGDFNTWDGRRHPMRLRREAGVWEIFIPDLTVGERYKFEILDGQGSVLA
jgi:1,4-alpha-glucan branching enzyme